MLPIEQAILRTVLYADVFNFPLTAAEIQHFLIAESPASLEDIETALLSPQLQSRLVIQGEYVMRKGREELVALRQRREQVADHLWRKAVRYGIWLGRLPFVRMVAITGALAMRNPSDHDDDLDYMLVTAPGRVWLARLFAIAVVKVAKLEGGVTVCPNYVLAETALEQKRRDLFIAHEVTQMTPLCGHSIYETMREQNRWVMAELPNADGAFYDESEVAPGGVWRLFQRLFEAVLTGRIGDRLEAWEYRRKVARFARQMQTPHSAAQLDPENVKGHFKDHGHPVLIRYQELLREFGLSEAALPLAGD